MSDVFAESVLIMKEKEKDVSSQFLNDYYFSNRRSQKAEKTFKTALLNLDAAFCGSDILSLYENYENLRKNEKALLVNQLKELKQSIYYLHHLQTCSQTESQKKDICNVINAVRDFVKADISHFKEHERMILFKLAEEEHCLFRDLEDISRNMPLLSKQSKKKYSSLKVADCNLPFEVTEFQDFIEKNNGHLGGWNEKDHYLFLKLRAKYKEKPFFFREVSKVFCHLKASEIKDHELWYVEYLNKKERKDSVLFQWKQEQLQKTQKSCKIENSSPKDLRPHLSSAQRKQKMLKLQAWKQDRMMLKKKESIERNSLKKAKEEMAKQKFLDHQKEIKDKLKRYKEQKTNQVSTEVSFSLSIDNKCTKQQVVRKIIKILQMRDELSFMKKKEKAMIHELKNVDKELKLKNRVKVDVPYDPDRLLKPTQASIRRKQQVGSKDFEMPTYLPRRATPTWRKDIS